jgi:hypothetical protein
MDRDWTCHELYHDAFFIISDLLQRHWQYHMWFTSDDMLRSKNVVSGTGNDSYEASIGWQSTVHIYVVHDTSIAVTKIVYQRRYWVGNSRYNHRYKYHDIIGRHVTNIMFEPTNKRSSHTKPHIIKAMKATEWYENVVIMVQ